MDSFRYRTLVQSLASRNVAARNGQGITMKTLMICAVIAFFLLSGAYGKSTYDPFWDVEEYHCGSELADEMEVVCQGKYTIIPMDSPMASYEYRRKMKIPLIVDECCHSPCSRRTLLTYC